MKQNPWLKWIAVAATVILGIGILYTIWGLRQSHKVQKAQLEQTAAAYAAQLRPLWEEKAALERQLYDLEKAHREEKDTTAYICLLVTEPDQRILTDILPSLEKYGYPGVVALSANALPGAANCLSPEQLKQLTDQGWELCLTADADTDIVGFVEKSKALGYEAKAIYFPNDDCTQVQKTQMQQLGLPVIRYGREVASGVDEKQMTVQAYGSNENNARSLFNSSVNGATVLALTVGYQNGREKFNVENYGNMLATVAGSVKAEKCRVAGVSAVTQMYMENEQRWLELEQEYRSRRSELEAQLNAVILQIREIE